MNYFKSRRINTLLRGGNQTRASRRWTCTRYSLRPGSKTAPNRTAFQFPAQLASLASGHGWREAACSYSGMAHDSCALALAPSTVYPSPSTQILISFYQMHGAKPKSETHPSPLTTFVDIGKIPELPLGEQSVRGGGEPCGAWVQAFAGDPRKIRQIQDTWKCLPPWPDGILIRAPDVATCIRK